MPMLHVANGHSATALIRRAGIAGELSVWADALHEGPVPGGISNAELRAVRASYLSGSGHGADYEETLADLASWDCVLDATSYEEIVLWYEHDLFDQLNLIQLLDRLASRAGGPPVHMICIGAFPGKPAFKGLGELTPHELASLWDTRQPVAEGQFALAGRAWEAFRSADPRRLEEFLDEDLSALPFLKSALRRHLEEFPSSEHGLSRTERRLLQIASGSAVEIHETFHRMHDDETCFYVADASFWRMARELAAIEPAIIAIETREEASERLPRGSLSLMPSGQSLLEGRTDRVRENGIDRWLGGAHLTGRGPTWRWNSQSQRLTWA